jgi:hypothetical protein
MSLELLIGPMFAGKSSAIQSIIRRHQALGWNVFVVTHSMDTRYTSEPAIVNHDKVAMPAHATNSLMTLVTNPEYVRSRLVVIEEAQFFPDLVKQGHVFVLETPLLRVRNKQKTIYCYDETEKQAAIKELGSKPEITRFKGLGEISPEEFGKFINADIKLDPVILEQGDHIQHLLEYYMGKNTQERQDFIINNLKVELDKAHDTLSI